MTITLFVAGQPVPKQRPRVSNGHAYTPARTRAWEQEIGWMARAVGMEPMAGDVGITLRFQRKGRVRADLDNLVKAVLDGLNGIAFGDDRQIIELVADVHYGCASPGVHIAIEDKTD